jgi:alkylated DNA repair dioxygenase AlkB
MIFGDPIVTLSLGSAADFVFSRSGYEDITYYLKPGTLVIMSGPTRYYYKHTIPARSSDTVNGEKIPRSTRISITYRLMAPNKWKVKLAS